MLGSLSQVRPSQSCVYTTTLDNKGATGQLYLSGGNCWSETGLGWTPEASQDSCDQLHEVSRCAGLKCEGPLRLLPHGDCALLLHGKNLPIVSCALHSFTAFTRGYTAWSSQLAFSINPMMAEGTLKLVFKQCVTWVLRQVTKHSSITAIQQGLLCRTRR